MTDGLSFNAFVIDCAQNVQRYSVIHHHTMQSYCQSVIYLQRLRSLEMVFKTVCKEIKD